MEFQLRRSSPAGDGAAVTRADCARGAHSVRRGVVDLGVLSRRPVMPFVVQFWMIAPPVAYPSSLVMARWSWLYGLNPMAGVIDGFRWALTGHGQPPGIAMAASAVGVGVVSLGGLVFFQRMETNIADRS